MIISKVKTFLQRYSICNCTILIACSGGADSTALVVALSKLQKECSLSLVVAHINYHLRGDDSEADFFFVQNLCKEYTISFYYKNEDLSTLSTGMEERARAVRYSFFNELKEQLSISYIAVAHNQNDQAETALFRLARGAGPKGVSAMEPLRKDGVLRPLLFCSRNEIESFLKEEGLSWREDKSNRDTIYKRNLIRHKILPLLQEINPKAIEHIAQFTSLLQENEQLKEAQIGKWIEEQMIYSGSDHGILLRHGEAPSFLKSALYMVVRGVSQVAEEHVVSLVELWERGKGRVELPGKVVAEMVGDVFHIAQEKDEFPLWDVAKLSIGDNAQSPSGRKIASRVVKIGEKLSFDKENRKVYINSSHFPLSIYSFSKVSSAKITLLGSGRIAPVSKVLKKAGITQPLRDYYPIVLNRDGEVLWIPEVAFSNVGALQEKEDLVELTFSSW